MQINNLLKNAQPPLEGEQFEALLTHKNLRIERIISSANFSPSEYNQEQDEWVLMVQGHATMLVAGETIELTTGDYLFLPSGTIHSVLSASEGAIWLAIHLFDSSPSTDVEIEAK